VTSTGYKGPTPDRTAAQRDREAAFARIGRVRGATLIGAATLTAAIAAVVSAVAPGRTLGAKEPGHVTTVASRTASTHTGPLVMPPLENPSQLGLRGPANPPRPQGTAPQGTAPQGTQPQAQTQTQSAPAPQPAAPAPVVSGGS
jgi:hypothetical protein